MDRSDPLFLGPLYMWILSDVSYFYGSPFKRNLQCFLFPIISNTFNLFFLLLCQTFFYLWWQWIASHSKFSFTLVDRGFIFGTRYWNNMTIFLSLFSLCLGCCGAICVFCNLSQHVFILYVLIWSFYLTVLGHCQIGFFFAFLESMSTYLMNICIK